jgi:hypothetical protein
VGWTGTDLNLHAKVRGRSTMEKAVDKQGCDQSRAKVRPKPRVRDTQDLVPAIRREFDRA